MALLFNQDRAHETQLWAQLRSKLKAAAYTPNGKANTAHISPTALTALTALVRRALG
jgi:hypothetical protein